MARQMMDIKLVDVSGGADLAVVNGDFAVVESKAAHNKNLIHINKGELKDAPTRCVGAFNYLDDENPSDLLNAISAELTRDGMNVKSVAMGADNVIRTDAFYI